MLTQKSESSQALISNCSQSIITWLLLGGKRRSRDFFTSIRRLWGSLPRAGDSVTDFFLLFPNFLANFRMGGDWEEGEDEPYVVLGEVVSSDNGDHAFTIQRQVGVNVSRAYWKYGG